MAFLSRLLLFSAAIAIFSVTGCSSMMTGSEWQALPTAGGYSKDSSQSAWKALPAPTKSIRSDNVAVPSRSEWQTFPPHKVNTVETAQPKHQGGALQNPTISTPIQPEPSRPQISDRYDAAPGKREQVKVKRSDKTATKQQRAPSITPRFRTLEEQAGGEINMNDKIVDPKALKI
jgi:hypothetical protein